MPPTRIRFARSASRHRIARERSAYVIAHCGLPQEDEGVILYLGDDWNGVPLEVAAVERGGDLVVVHAMRLRSKFRDLYVEALPWRR